MSPGIEPDINRLASLIWSNPVLARIRETAGDRPVLLVGGAIRDGLAGREIDDLDLVVEGDPAELASRLDPEAKVNGRFGTVDIVVDGMSVDIATARTETYARPGALPDVTPGSFEDDLRRRDFTINAMAIGIGTESELIDPFNGYGDLVSGVIRVLHDRSFEDDPTRALRAARYAARFGFDLDPRTTELIFRADLGSISRDRVENELRLIAGEENALDALRLVRAWGLIDFDPERLDLAARALAVLRTKPWQGSVDRQTVILGAVFGDLEPIAELRPDPVDAWEGCRRAGGRELLDLVLARAAGVEWLDRWQSEWRWVELEITGADLLAAGVPQGPWVGEGLDAALRAKLAGEAPDAESEMLVAIAAARAAQA